MDLITLLTQINNKSALFYIVLAVYVLTQIAPLFQHKVKSAKVEHIEKRMNMALTKAKQIVVPIANEVGLSNADRREKAVSMLYQFLTDRGLHVDRNELYAVVETAYQYMKKSGFLDDKQPKTTGNPEDLSEEELKDLIPNK